MTVYRHIARDYASQNGLKESEVIELIKRGEISGVHDDGNWYVRIVDDENVAINQDADENKKQQLFTVEEYAKQHDLPVALVLDEIASGIRNGFHKGGVWYIGKDERYINTKDQFQNTAKSASRQKSRSAFFPLVMLIAVGGLFYHFSVTTDEKKRNITRAMPPRSDSLFTEQGKFVMDKYYILADGISDQYKRNEIAADAKWRGEKIKVEGQIRYIGRDVTGNPFVVLGSNGFLGVKCIFSLKDEYQLVNLSKGEVASFVGKVEGKYIHVHLTDCSKYDY